MLRALGSLVIAVLLATEVKAEGYPLDYWARRAAVGNIELSPDGSKFALLRILERGGNPIIEIYETDNLDKEPRRIDSKPMEITSLGGWITDDTLIFSARQQVRDQIEGWNQGTTARSWTTAVSVAAQRTSVTASMTFATATEILGTGAPNVGSTCLLLCPARATFRAPSGPS